MTRIQVLSLICITAAIEPINWLDQIVFNTINKILKTKILEHLYL